jgi:hypothetical protein
MREPAYAPLGQEGAPVQQEDAESPATDGVEVSPANAAESASLLARQSDQSDQLAAAGGGPPAEVENDEASKDSEDVEAPLWFEHEWFALLDKKSVVVPLQLLLAATPLLNTAGQILELLLGCAFANGVSVKVQAFTIAGTFVFSATGVFLLRGLRDVVYGAHLNEKRKKVELNEVEAHDSSAEQDLASRYDLLPPRQRFALHAEIIATEEDAKISLHSLHVGGIPDALLGSGIDAAEATINRAFARHGTVVAVEVRDKSQKSQNKSWAFVSFRAQAAADAALATGVAVSYTDSAGATKEASLEVKAVDTRKQQRSRADDQQTEGASKSMWKKQTIQAMVGVEGTKREISERKKVGRRVRVASTAGSQMSLQELRMLSQDMMSSGDMALSADLASHEATTSSADSSDHHLSMRAVGKVAVAAANFKDAGKEAAETAAVEATFSRQAVLAYHLEQMEQAKHEHLENAIAEAFKRAHEAREHGLQTQSSMQQRARLKTENRQANAADARAAGARAAAANSFSHTGPLSLLSFAGGLDLERVMLRPDEDASVHQWRNFLGLLGIGLIVAAVMMASGVVELLLSDFDRSELSVVGGVANQMFFPDDGCVSNTTLRMYGYTLLVLWVPAAIVSAVVWPLWLLSLQLGVVLANDNVEDLMRDCGPDDVKQYLEDGKGQKLWKRQVELPAAMLVSSLEELSAWGPAMFASTIGCWGFTIFMLPMAAATDSLALWAMLVMTAAMPMTIAYAPASVSSSCDAMLNQLNDISFLGDVEHKERCSTLRDSLLRLNDGQGLGFRVMGTVIDKRMLFKIMGLIMGGGSTVMTTLVALGARGDAVLTCSTEFVATCCSMNVTGAA